MAEIIGKWVGPAFYPHPDWIEKASKMKRDVWMKAAITQPRNIANHNHFFGLIHRVWENLPDHITMTEDDLREDLLIMAGYSYVYVDLNGNTQVRAKSIAHSELSDETKFNDLKAAVIKVILTRIFPELNNENNELAILDMVS